MPNRDGKHHNIVAELKEHPKPPSTSDVDMRAIYAAEQIVGGVSTIAFDGESIDLSDLIGRLFKRSPSLKSKSLSKQAIDDVANGKPDRNKKKSELDSQ